MPKEHTKLGKWSQPGVPHKDWRCVYVEDLGEPSHLCGMCESVQVRYVHYMAHPDYTGELGVGCVCAENMEHDSCAAKRREQSLKNTARRRVHWPKRQWRVSAKGNTYLNAGPFNVVVFSKNGSWSFRVQNRQTEKAVFSRRRYPTQEEAVAASFDGLIWAEQNLR